MKHPSKASGPAYYQIKTHFVAKIRQGEWPLDFRIPAEPAIQKLFAVSRGTVQRALLELELEGYIRREHGKGTFVANTTARVPYELSEIASFSEQIKKAGMRPSMTVLGKCQLPAEEAGDRVMTALDAKRDETIVKFRILRLADESPISLQTVFLRNSRCPEIMRVEFSSLFKLYRERYGVQILETDEVLWAASPTTEEAGLLDLAPNTHVVVRERVSFDQHKAPFEFVHTVAPEDKLRYHYHSAKNQQVLSSGKPMRKQMRKRTS